MIDMSSIFKVGVHVGMTTNASQILSTMLKELTGVHIQAGKLSGALDTISKAAVGVGLAFAGWEVGKSIWHAIEGNRELNKELERTKQLGGDFAANLAQTRAQAFRTANDAPTSVVSDNVRMSRELGSTLGHPQAAMEMLSEATKVAYLVHNYTGEAQEDIVKNLIRTADARAQVYTTGADGKEHVDPVKLMAELDAAYKGLVLGGGFATSQGMLQTARMGGAVVKEQTPEAFYAAGVEAAIALGASRLGTAETSLMAQFIGGTMTKKVAEHLTEAGLLHSDEWTSGKSGGVVVNAKAAQRFEPMMKDPIAWLETGEGGQAIKAYAMKEGITITSSIMQLFGRQTTQRLANDAMSNAPQFARAREIYGNIPDVQKAYKELHDNDLDTNLTEISSAWKSFMQAFSDAGTPVVIPFLHGLTDVIHLLMDGAGNYPKITEGLIGLAGGIAALTALGGGLIIFNLCWAPLITGLRLLVVVGGGLASAGATLASFAGGLSTLAGIITGPVGAALAVLGIMKPSATNSGEDEFLKAHRGPDGQLQQTPYVAPGSKPVQLRGDLNVDGKKMGSYFAESTADALSRPQSGTTQPDLRMTPWMAGLSGVSY